MYFSIKKFIIGLGLLIFLAVNLAVSFYFYKKNKLIEEKLLSPPENQTSFENLEYLIGNATFQKNKNQTCISEFFTWLGSHWNKKFKLQDLVVNATNCTYLVILKIKIPGSFIQVQQSVDRFLLGLENIVTIKNSNLTFYRKKRKTYGILNLILVCNASNF